MKKVVSTYSEAQATGYNYFTGKPCKWGHICEREPDAKCVECRRALGRAAYHRHKLPPKRVPSPWSYDLVERLRVYASAGLTGGQIANKLQCVTRSAVIGKCYREGIKLGEWISR